MSSRVSRTGRNSFVAGSVLAVAGSADAGIVQITLTNNQISNAFGNTLFADLTGDGTDDILFTGARASTAVSTGTLGSGTFYSYRRGSAGFYNAVDSVYALAISSYTGTSGPKSYLFVADASLGLGSGGFGSSFVVTSSNNPINPPIRYFNLINFTDLRINGGAPTDGFLEVVAGNNGVLDNYVQLARLIFDDENTQAPMVAGENVPTFPEFVPVPEPTGLALLALGGAGVLAARRRRKAG